MEQQPEKFIDYIEQSIIRNWDRNALTDYKGITLQYKDVARKIAKFHIVLESAGIRPGDKIAVCGRNSAHWAVCFLATLTYGAVIVPILHEFKADNVHNIVNHSEAKLLFNFLFRDIMKICRKLVKQIGIDNQIIRIALIKLFYGFIILFFKIKETSDNSSKAFKVSTINRDNCF